MKGLDLHRGFFEEYGRPMLAEAFPEEFPLLAVASVGFGSDRLYADDLVSQDHCWEPGFQIFSDRLPREVLKRIERYLFENLPWEFQGVRRSDCCGSPNTIRAWTLDEFFACCTCFAVPPERDRHWLLITDEALCTVTDGEVFHDPTGALGRRRQLFSYYPDNVWRFKLTCRAYRIDVHRYMLARCIAHGEAMAATLLFSEAIREVLHFACLVNRRYAPYDRWLHWTFRRLPEFACDIDPLVTRLFQTSDVLDRMTLYERIEELCAEWTYNHGLAVRKAQGDGSWPMGAVWWANLRETIDGDLKGFPVPGWVGVEYRYASQFSVGDFRKLLNY